MTDFEIQELETYSSVQNMLQGEAHWIEKLGTMAPSGYNLMRGGSSAGGPSNAKPCEIFLGDTTREFTSITSAIEAVALFHNITEETEFRRYYGRVRARMNYKGSQPWTLAEALELEPREDFRKTVLSKKAKASGENLGTARSREYRQKRTQELASVEKVRIIPHPEDSGKTVSIGEAAKLFGIADSTLRWRLDQIRPNISQMQPQEIIAHLKTAQEREKPVRVFLPGEKEPVELGYNALARKYQRKGHSVSAIKARLRKMSSSPTNDELLVAIGLTEPPPRTRVVHVKAISRKKHCDDWTVSFDMSAHQFPNQAAFVRACAEVLMNMPGDRRKLGKSPTDMVKVIGYIRGVACRMTKGGTTPNELADFFGIREELSRYGRKK